MEENKLDENLLAEMHALSSASKAYASWSARDGIQTVKKKNPPQHNINEPSLGSAVEVMGTLITTDWGFYEMKMTLH